VTIRNLLISGSGSTGIYLEAGSKDNAVHDNVIVDNGYRENGRPEGQTFVFAGITFRFWGPGREGLAIDGSWNNHVSGNYFEGNQNGSILLYTNCGEFVTQNPGRWYQRRYGAEHNVIEQNQMVGGPNGVWVGSRMGENTLPMECSDPAYHTGPLLRVVLDRAANNTVRNNTFEDVMYGVRVEDDGTTVEGNTFTAPDDTHHAVVVGTTWRTMILDHPVRNTTVRNNVSNIVGNTHPYRWVHGQESTVSSGNRALGQPVPICEGEALPVNIMIFVLHAVIEDPNGPPTPKPDFPVPTLGSLPPCDPLPHIVPGKGTIAEGGAGDANVVEVPVTLSEPSTSPVTASWTTLHQPGLKGNPAEPGTDYVPASGHVTFAPGETAKTVPVELIGDADIEPNEYVVVSLANPVGGYLGGFLGLGYGTITNDDQPVTIVPGSASVTEGDAGTTIVEVPITLDRPSTDEVSAEWATAFVGAGHPVEAVPGTDYQAASGSVTFAPGETEALVTVTVNGDVDLEGDELFLVRLTNPIGGRLGGLFGLGFAAILDDD
jgi:parallel beta-helix repeat protein